MELQKLSGNPVVDEVMSYYVVQAREKQIDLSCSMKIRENLALNLADNADAKMETLTELFASSTENGSDWLGYNRLFESNIRRTGEI